MAFSESQIGGKVNYNKDIILSIIKIATTEIKGVSGLSENFGSLLKRWFGENYGQGISITNSFDNLTINVYIKVVFGNNVTEIAYRVQQNIKNALASMVNLEINKINVHVLGVSFEDNKDTAKQVA